jgi:soluble lytic murein transglycosylase-like protein
MPSSRLAVAGPVLAILAVLLVPARAARAELVVFEDGRVVKAARYEVRGDELEIALPGGGSFSVEMARVERIVDDEVAPPSAVAEVTPPKADPALVYDLGYRHDRKPLFGTAYDSIIAAEAKRYNVDAALVSALIRAESNFDPRAVSRKGARGLMQLMPATARRLDVRRPFDPVSNVRGGVRYLRELLERFDNRPELVLAAYNAGEGAVENYGGVPPYRETVGYVKRILSWWTPAVVPAPAQASVSVSR